MTTTAEYIRLHRHEEPALLALKGAPQGVDLPFALRQIEGWRTAVKKLPRWAAVDDIIYPVRLSMQQCSSQLTAEYKAQVVQSLIFPDERHTMADLTGGLGVDFSFIAPLFKQAVYVERDEALCAAARHNMPLLGLPHAKVVNAEAESVLDTPYSFIYMDPARRDTVGRKLVRIEDCQPDVATLQDLLLQLSPVVMVKLSPMLDITQAQRTLHHISQIHIVAADGECKELLLVMQRGYEGEPTIHCEGMTFTRSQEVAAMPHAADTVKQYLYVPSAAIMKAAPFRLLATQYDILVMPQDTHLYTSATMVNEFPGRTLMVLDVCDVKSLRRQHPEITAANIIVRGYPDTPESLRKRLKLKDGGQYYIVATTLPSSRRALLLCDRIR